MPSESGSNEAHLARIRDNQRRSRARRKEYQLELETKWRECEQKGAEASAELQAVARRVLDENKRLRALLRAKGTAEDEIDDYVLSEMPMDPAPPSDILKIALTTRKVCGPGSASSCSTSRKGSTGNDLPPTRTATVARGISQPRPLSTLSATSDIYGMNQASTSPVAFTPSNLTSPTSIYTPLMPNHPYYNPGMSISNPSAALPHAPQHVQPASGHSLEDFSSVAWQAWPPTDPSANDTDGPADQSFTDCADAAQIIRSMSVAQVGEELESDLGCTATGGHCKVDNNQMFEVLDKYSGLGPTRWS